MQVKIKKLTDYATIPSYAKNGDAGMDLTAITKVDISTSKEDFIEYGTGLAIEIPEGYVGLIYPRSSISKYGLMLANSVGVIDSGYRGEIILRFKKTCGLAKSYNIDDKIGQLVIIPYPLIQLKEVNELSDTERGNGGFGSTTLFQGA
jgi:dUTP pyrophosphatase